MTPRVAESVGPTDDWNVGLAQIFYFRMPDSGVFPLEFLVLIVAKNDVIVTAFISRQIPHLI